MRQRMAAQSPGDLSRTNDIKQGKGGIVDIEFLVQFLTLNHAWQHPALTRWTDNIRLIETLEKELILTGDQAKLLKKTYIALRKTLHRLDLQEKKERRRPDGLQAQAQAVSDLFEQFLHD